MEPEVHLLRGAQSLLNQYTKKYIKTFALENPLIVDIETGEPT
jgi:hypothetical protein